MDVTGVMSSAEDERVEVPLEVELFRLSRLAGDLFHMFRVNEGSDLMGDGCTFASQCAMNEARTPSRMRL